MKSSHTGRVLNPATVLMLLSRRRLLHRYLKNVKSVGIAWQRVLVNIWILHKFK